MNAQAQPPQPSAFAQEIPSGPHKAVPSLRSLLVADWVDSTGLIQRLGDRAAPQLFHQHDLLLERILERCQGRLIDKADGILALFARPVQAVEFAFRYQQGLRELGDQLGLGGDTLAARVGIHVGEVMLWANPPERIAQGAKPIEVEGLAKPVAARLMSLALPNQILMSGMAQTLAQRAQDELGEFGKVQWQVHGRYRFKGVPAPMIVHEVGLPGVNPLRMPPSSDKAKREVPLWRQPLVLATEGALVVSLVGFGLWSALKSPPAIAFAERDWVVLGDVQNLTAEPTFSGSLDAAWRVGLEQSRFVNVVTELHEEVALQRMQRQGQSLDRTTGVELALREGARALVLPTIAEVGGRVRISAEIIDPASGVTVHTASADGKGRDSVLAASDVVLTEVREFLGEPESQLRRDSRPMAQVTTSSLNALKAFNAAEEAMANHSGRQAVVLLQRAIEIDPEFSAAHARLAAVYLLGAQMDKALVHMEQGLRDTRRLTDRERLYLLALRANVDDPLNAADRWRQLVGIYPDYLTGQQNLADIQWRVHNDFPAARAAFDIVARSRHPLRSYSLQNLGTMQTALGDYPAARASYIEAAKQGNTVLYDGQVDPYLAARDYAAARNRFSPLKDGDLPQQRVWKSMRRIGMAADRGQISEALKRLDALRADATVSAVPAHLAQLLVVEAGLREQTKPGSGRPALQTFFQRYRVAGPSPMNDSREGVNPLYVAMAGLLAARAGDAALAERASEALAPLRGKGKLALIDQYLEAIHTELAISKGVRVPSGSAALSAPNLPLQLQWTRWRALQAEDQAKQAESLAAQMCRSRGRAVAEWNEGFTWYAVNLMAVNRACLALESTGSTDYAKEVADLRRGWQAADRDWPFRRDARAGN